MVLAALGMLSSDDRAVMRQRVRNTMLVDAPPSIAFRFVVGRLESGGQDSLQLESVRYGDVVRVDALDRGDEECSCAEKMVGWFRLALQAFPTALFVGKTEHDTYVQLHALALELEPHRSSHNLVLGFMALAVHPTRPIAAGLAERKAAKACGPLENSCGSFEDALFVEGCVLGDLEGKLAEPGQARRLLRSPSLLRLPRLLSSFGCWGVSVLRFWDGGK